MSIRKRWLSNAGANVFGGVFGAIFSLLVPAILSRSLSKDDFSIWSISVQIVVYVQVFSAGVQMAVARDVAATEEISDSLRQTQTVGAAWRISSVTVFVGLMATAAWAFSAPLFFKGFAGSGTSSLVICSLWLGVGATLQLFSLVPSGIFMGLHKNHKWVAAQSLSRVMAVAVILVGSFLQADVVWYSVAFSIGCISVVPISVLVIYKTERKFFSLFKTTRDKLKQVGGYCLTMGVWNVSVLLIGGVSTSLVGIYDPANIGAYALAVTGVNVFNAVLQAVLSPIGVNSASLMASSESDFEVGRLVLNTTKYCGLFFVFVVLTYLFLGCFVVELWVGDTYSLLVSNYLLILLLAACLRNFFLPLSIVLLATKNPRVGLVATIFEGLAVLTASVVLGERFGALGVAWASMVGSVLGSFFVCFYVVEAMKNFVGSRRRFLLKTNSVIVLFCIAATLVYVLMRTD